MDVPRFREKANLLTAHIKSFHLQDATQTEADILKNINRRLFISFFLVVFIIFLFFVFS